jgi:hypothetical protein
VIAVLLALLVLPSPAGNGAAEPFLFATRDGVLLSWLEPVAGTKSTALRFARWRDRKWTAPHTIVERDDLFVNWADFPSIVEDRGGALFAHWLQKNGPGPFDYDVRMATSTDGGATWSASFVVNRDGRQGEHGFASVLPLPRGGVGVAWLDGRTKEMTIRYATVDAKGRITSDEQLDARACECCATGMAMTARGPVVAYRDRSADEIRDIAIARRGANGWTAPRALHDDRWKINGCPVNGPQFDAIGDRVVAAWFTAANGQNRALVAFSPDGGTTFGKPVTIDDGKPAGRVDVVLLDDNTALVTWLEQTGTTAEIRARRVTRNGPTQPSIRIAESSTARAAGFPRIARHGRDVYIAWTEQTAEGKRVRVARERF